MFTCLLSPIPGQNHVNYGPGVLQLTETLVFQFFGVSVFLGSTYLLRRYLEPLWYSISFWTLTNRPCLSTPTWRPRVVKDIGAAWLTVQCYPEHCFSLQLPVDKKENTSDITDGQWYRLHDVPPRRYGRPSVASQQAAGILPKA